MTYETIAIPGGFIKLMRSDATRELLKDPKAFTLYTQIALRARRTNDFNIHGLAPGQALIGDCENCGLSQQEYRRAKIRLERYGLARFEGTSKGTIATLCSTVIYDINVTTLEQVQNEQGTNEERTGNDQRTTIKNEKNEKKEKKGKAHHFYSSRSADSTPRTFEEMDHDRARQAMAGAQKEFLTDDKA
jgi:hypothetical protein